MGSELEARAQDPVASGPGVRADGRAGFGALAPAGFASIGAGTVHVAAAVIHHDQTPAVIALGALAVLQLAWGAVAFERDDRRTAAAGLAIAAVAVGGWIWAKSVGIAAVAGLDRPEGIQWADGVAVVLAVGVLAVCARAVLHDPEPGEVGVRPTADGHRRAAVVTSGVVVALVALALGTIRGHDHGQHDEGPGGVAAYDPAVPPDLGDVPGIEPGQARAGERLLARTVAAATGGDLPVSLAAARSAGFDPAGTWSGGRRLLLDGARLDDGATLDPSAPEGLVFERGRALVAVAYAVGPDPSPGETAALADLAGPATTVDTLTGLCGRSSGGASAPASGDGAAGDAGERELVGPTDAAGRCPAGAEPVGRVVVLLAWVAPQPCGPFATLTQVAAADCTLAHAH